MAVAIVVSNAVLAGIVLWLAVDWVVSAKRSSEAGCEDGAEAPCRDVLS